MNIPIKTWEMINKEINKANVSCRRGISTRQNKESPKAKSTHHGRKYGRNKLKCEKYRALHS